MLRSPSERLEAARAGVFVSISTTPARIAAARKVKTEIVNDGVNMPPGLEILRSGW
jgi:hypothetical protein